MKYEINDLLIVDFPVSEKRLECFVVGIEKNDKVYQVEFYDGSCRQVMIAESQIIKKVRSL